MGSQESRRAKRALSGGLVAGLALFLCGALPLLPSPRLLQSVSGLLLLAHVLMLPAGLLALLALPVYGIASMLQSRPRWALPGLLFCVAFAASAGAGVLGGAALRRARFADTAEAARPLIEALETFRARGAYPESLDDLYRGTPDRPPRTGLLAYPEFDYRRPGKDDDFPDYELRVVCPMGPFNEDVFVYRPGRSYSPLLYGGRVERIGDWAYVHQGVAGIRIP